MRITPNFDVTEAYLEKLREKSSKDLKKWIKEQNFFRGLATTVKDAKEREIYEKIYVRRPNKGNAKTDTTKTRKRGKRDSS